MNPECPTCGYNWALNGFPDGGNPVPYEENDKLFTLHFCSEECRDEYKQDNT